jgi:ABC-type multidrug transport system fused ATPase/permease subunit
VTPLKCYFSYCPEGSEYAPKTYLVAVMIVILIIVFYFFNRKKHYDRLRMLKHRQQMMRLVATDRKMDMVTARIEKQRRFDIEFIDLGLTLPSGSSIMKGVSGKLTSGRACAIMGPSGAGKVSGYTTHILLLFDFYYYINLSFNHLLIFILYISIPMFIHCLRQRLCPS